MMRVVWKQSWNLSYVGKTSLAEHATKIIEKWHQDYDHKFPHLHGRVFACSFIAKYLVWLSSYTTIIISTQYDACPSPSGEYKKVRKKGLSEKNAWLYGQDVDLVPTLHPQWPFCMAAVPLMVLVLVWYIMDFPPPFRNPNLASADVSLVTDTCRWVLPVFTCIWLLTLTTRSLFNLFL